jgi:hypothetical protein
MFYLYHLLNSNITYSSIPFITGRTHQVLLPGSDLVPRIASNVPILDNLSGNTASKFANDFPLNGRPSFYTISEM